MEVEASRPRNHHQLEVEYKYETLVEFIQSSCGQEKTNDLLFIVDLTQFSFYLKQMKVQLHVTHLFAPKCTLNWSATLPHQKKKMLKMTDFNTQQSFLGH